MISNRHLVVVLSLAILALPIAAISAHADPVPAGPIRIHPGKVLDPMCFGMVSSADVVFVTRTKSGCKDGQCDVGSYLARTDRKRAETVGYLAHAKGATLPERAAVLKTVSDKALEAANEKLAEADLPCGTVVLPAPGQLAASITLGGYTLSVARDGPSVVFTNVNGFSERFSTLTPDLETVTAVHYSPGDPRVVVRIAIANPDGGTDERFAWMTLRHLPQPSRAPLGWTAAAPGTLIPADLGHSGCIGARAADDTMFVLLQGATCDDGGCTRKAYVTGFGAGASGLDRSPLLVARARGVFAPDDAALAAGVDIEALTRANGLIAGALLACNETPVQGSQALVISDTKFAMSVVSGGPVLRSELNKEWRGWAPAAGERAMVLGTHPKLRTLYLRTSRATPSQYDDGALLVRLDKPFFHRNAADAAEDEQRRSAALDASARAATDMAAAIERAKIAVEEDKVARAARDAEAAKERAEREAEAAKARAEREARDKEAAERVAAERARLQAPPPGTLEERMKAIKAIDTPVPEAWWNIEYRCLGWSTDEPTVFMIRWFESDYGREALLSNITPTSSFKLVTLVKDGEPWKHMWAGADRKVQTSELGCVGGDSGALQDVPFQLKVEGSRVMLTMGPETKQVTRLTNPETGADETYHGAVWHPTLPYLVVEIGTSDESGAATTRYVWQDLSKLIARAKASP